VLLRSASSYLELLRFASNRVAVRAVTGSPCCQTAALHDTVKEREKEEKEENEGGEKEEKEKKDKKKKRKS
jgi:hypothetical protein